MRNLLFSITAAILLVSVTIISTIQHESYAEQGVPSYAKWGKLATEETKSKYPEADIIDYLHRGVEKKEDSTIEKFKLWLKGEDKEFGVFVNIEFHTDTEEVLSITFTETSR
ncbi:DUF3889 domain-containing protein [Virgibacillus byunsanensis]|uniref:DUF3889 domain-containing protein n=1 Tax=Virgibacillus byunsanensis TaxID=570945 RepID=A0ABW3LU29_9BACI